MKLTGSYKLNVKKSVVWKSLNDTSILKKCIPGCESFEIENNNKFNVKATNQIGPMNATFSGTVNLSNIIENQSYTLSGEAQSSVGFANGSADVKLNENNGTTVLTYEVNVNIGGKIAQLGSRLINGVAKKMSDYFFGRFADLVSPLIEEEEKTGSVIEKEKERVKEIKSNFLNKYIYSISIILILLLVAVFYLVSR